MRLEKKILRSELASGKFPLTGKHSGAVSLKWDTPPDQPALCVTLGWICGLKHGAVKITCGDNKGVESGIYSFIPVVHLNKRYKSALRGRPKTLRLVIRHELLHLEMDKDDNDPAFIEAAEKIGADSETILRSWCGGEK